VRVNSPLISGFPQSKDRKPASSRGKKMGTDRFTVGLALIQILRISLRLSFYAESAFFTLRDRSLDGLLSHL
jgi:hypothetical protein